MLACSIEMDLVFRTGGPDSIHSGIELNGWQAFHYPLRKVSFCSFRLPRGVWLFALRLVGSLSPSLPLFYSHLLQAQSPLIQVNLFPRSPGHLLEDYLLLSNHAL